jgi:carbamoyltransferase
MEILPGLAPGAALEHSPGLKEPDRARLPVPVAVLGINAYHGDASAALVVDGELVAAIEEERLNRSKHCAGFPTLAIRECLRLAGLRPEQIQHAAISRDPLANITAKALYLVRNFAQVKSVAIERAKNLLRVRKADDALAKALGLAKRPAGLKLHHVEHHMAHLASAYLVSPFDRAACLSIDGFGDFASTLLARGNANRLEVLGRVLYPHSAGALYTAVTQYLGFPKYGEEWKVMGLAPYGKPTYADVIRRMIRPTSDGLFELDLSYFSYAAEGVHMTWDEGSPTLGRLYGDRMVQELGPARDPASTEYYGRYADIAASLQVVYEEIFFHLLDHLHRETGLTDLCLAGGCALNSTANGKIADRSPFERVYIQPASGDDGTAVGAAFHVWNQVLGNPRSYRMDHVYLGPGFGDPEILSTIEAAKHNGWDPAITVSKLEEDELCRRAAGAVARGQIVGWFQGRLEFGPRALGNRSIVVDPRRAEMKDVLNERIKHRETYRPFAPSILEEHVGEYFERDDPAPFMIMIYRVRDEKKDAIPATTHVDQSGRLQAVMHRTNPRYHKLISEFAKETGVPVVLNTSFNEHEPIVCTPNDALQTFLKTKMDVLVLGDYYLERA